MLVPSHVRVSNGGGPCHQMGGSRARYMTLETIAPLSHDPIVKLPAGAA